MRVSHVAVDDFRSWKRGVVEFPPGPTVLLGHNGQGKTNLVEAIAYLSTFSSHRVGAESALVRIPYHEEDAYPAGAVIRVKLVSHDGRELILELEIVRGKANRAKINRTVVKPKDILGLVKTVVFAPEDLQLVRAEPGVRRRFLDDLATQMRPLFAQIRTDFDRVAKQRAALMKNAQSQVRRGAHPDLSTLAVWDEQFASLSAQVSAARCEVVRLLQAPTARIYELMSRSPKKLDMTFDASIDRTIGVDATDEHSGNLENIDAQIPRLLAALERVREREIDRGINLVGAHRDDLALTLGAMPVKGYASHGESWSAALSLRLASFEVLKDGEDTPILILDDVFAELDSARREGLAAMVSDADQVIVTAAVHEDVPSNLECHVVRIALTDDSGSVVVTDGGGADE